MLPSAWGSQQPCTLRLPIPSSPLSQKWEEREEGQKKIHLQYIDSLLHHATPAVSLQ